MLEDNSNNTNNTNNTNNSNFNSYHSSSHKNSFNSLSRRIDNDTHYSIFDVNKTNLLNSHTKKQIDDMEEILFSDY
jgi:hypothetical protein